MANPADFLALFGEDEGAAQAQAQALAEAMGRRRAAGTVASIIGGPFARAGQAFLGEAGQTQQDIGQAGVFRGQQQARRQALLQGAAQHRDALAQQRSASASAAHRHAEQMGLEREKMAQDAWAAVPDQLGGVVMFNRKTGESRPMGPQSPGGPGGPAVPNFKTEGQSNAYGFAGRIREARKQMEEAGYPDGASGRWDSAAMGAGGMGPLSGVIPQEAASEPGSRYFNAARNMVAAFLRKESGAAIGPDEWKFALNNYVPTPADSPELRANKLKMLDIMENAMVASAGPAGARALQTQVPQGPALTPNSPSAPPANNDVPVKIKSDADYDALPPGTRFEDPDGVIRRKP